jgi:LysR family transcriptional regulator, glycine cleavage system transcriptional activator
MKPTLVARSMNNRLPPFKSIEAFVVAAESLSFTTTASSLHITVPAVSRRIQALEAELGVALFQRTHRSLELTQVGEGYFQKLAPAIETIRQASMSVRPDPRRNVVKISVFPSFAANWLLPRLPRFFAQHSSIQIEFDTSVQYVDVGAGDIDVAIRFGGGIWPGLETELLLDAMIYPVCSPDFPRRGLWIQSPQDIVKYPLLGLSQQPDFWPQWLHAAKLAQPASMRFTNFDDCHLLYQAAANGLGIAIGLDTLVQPHLDDRRLRRLFDLKVKLPKKFYIVCQSHNRQRMPVHLFCTWLIAEAATFHSGNSVATNSTERLQSSIVPQTTPEIVSR